MEMKSKCVNLLNKLAYEVCHIKIEQNNILRQLEKNNEILEFNNALNSEILGIPTNYEIRTETYDFLKGNSHELILVLFCLYLNKYGKYNYYYPQFLNGEKTNRIKHVVIIPSEENKLREIIGGDDILESLKEFIDFIEHKEYNDKSVVEKLLDFLKDIEGISLMNINNKKYSKPSEILKLKQEKTEELQKYIRRNLDVKNKVPNLYNYIKELIESSRIELYSNHLNDVNNPYREEITKDDIIDNSKKLLLEDENRGNELSKLAGIGNVENTSEETYNKKEYNEPFEPSDYTSLSNLQDFDITTSDNTDANPDILNKLKNILEISTATDFETEN